jgi:hypothetical protein
MTGWLKKIFSVFSKKEEPVNPPEVKNSAPRCDVPDPGPLRSWDAFVLAIAMRESSDDYTAKNRYCYLGRYQFGLARLTDLGLCERIPGTEGWANKYFRWKSEKECDEAKFLASPDLQDRAFDLHVGMHSRLVLKKYQGRLGHKVRGVRLTHSGIIACIHLLGHGGFQHFLAGEDASDANGTKASDYLEDFAGYDIPDNLPADPRKSDIIFGYERFT